MSLSREELDAKTPVHYFDCDRFEVKAEESTISREGEGPHTFPGVEAANNGKGFFSSSCECGAFMSGFSSLPAKDRRDKKYQSAYGDRRGAGTCPLNLRTAEVASPEPTGGER